MNSHNFEPAITPFILFTDHVIREEGTGKHSFIGSFQHFNALRFPFVAPSFVVVAGFGNLRGSVERLNAAIRLEMPETGVVLASVGSELRVRGEVSPSDAFEIPFRLPPTHFPKPGLYSVVVLVENEEIASRPLMVREITLPQPE